MTEQARKHAEAFCLMDYKCQGCGHKELIWNSRDGVTSFGTGCPDPQCTGNMNHINWSLDRPFESLPKDADRVIVDMTREDAREIAEKRIHLFYEEPTRPPQISFETLVANIYRDGRQPLTVSVEEYKRRAGIEEPKLETPIEVEVIAECLREFAELRREGYGGLYPPERIDGQADALEQAFSGDDEEGGPDDFAKFWRFDDFGQVVVSIVGPSVKIFYQPRIPGIAPAELDLLAVGGRKGGDIGEVRARQVFSDMTRERVFEIVQKADAMILSETTSNATKH